MLTISVTELRIHLSKYVSMIESGKEEIIQITKNGTPIATMTPYNKKNSLLGLGVGKSNCVDYRLDGPEFNDIPKEFGY